MQHNVSANVRLSFAVKSAAKSAARVAPTVAHLLRVATTVRKSKVGNQKCLLTVLVYRLISVQNVCQKVMRMESVQNVALQIVKPVPIVILCCVTVHSLNSTQVVIIVAIGGVNCVHLCV